CALDLYGIRYCWGRNDSGQLGLGDTTSRTQPTSAYSIDYPAVTWQMISVGRDHGCGIRPSIGAYCWGSDFYGQLGNSNATNDGQPIPQPTVTRWFSVISLEGLATCGVGTNGIRYCWGDNNPTSRL